jgi:hypothetical protein
MSIFNKLMEPTYYTATVDHSSIPSHKVVRSSSLRQVTRFAACFTQIFVGMCDAAATLLEYFLLGRRGWNKRHPNGLCPKDLLGLEELSGGAQT